MRTAEARKGGRKPLMETVIGDDRMTADAAYRLARSGTVIEWRGDYHNARQLLAAMGRRARRGAPRRSGFTAQRRAAARQAEVLSMLHVPFEPGCVIPLRRAPDVRDACVAAGCSEHESFTLPLRELLGMIGAQQWRQRGVEIPALGERVYPHYGVFSPMRTEYTDLLAEAPLPAADLAFDIGTGTGVLAAVLAKRGMRRVLATDTNPRALACARENLERLGYADRVTVAETELFPPESASVIVCNPPWVPSEPSSALEQGIYDPESRMLRGFLAHLAAHLRPGGEGWLILSDLAEQLDLRERNELLGLFERSGLTVIDRLDTAPRHRKAKNPDDPLHAARAAETVSLWRLGADARNS